MLQILEEKVWLVGQSLGGIVAQIIAVTYPENIEGMVLSNTCSLEKNMGEDAYLHLMKMIHSQQKSKKLLSVIPFTIGMVNDMYAELNNDDYKYATVASQADFDLF